MTKQQNITFEMLEKMAMEVLIRALETSRKISKGNELHFANTEFDMGKFYGIVDIMQECEIDKFVTFWEKVKSTLDIIMNNIEKFYK